MPHVTLSLIGDGMLCELWNKGSRFVTFPGGGQLGIDVSDSGLVGCGFCHGSLLYNLPLTLSPALRRLFLLLNYCLLFCSSALNISPTLMSSSCDSLSSSSPTERLVLKPVAVVKALS